MTRHFVIVEPFRSTDFTIHRTEAAASAQFVTYRAAGRAAAIITTTGTVRDIRLILARRRAALLGAPVVTASALVTA